MKRYGMQIGLRPEAYDEYKRYHAAVWPEVLATIERCNIRNYTIYHHDGILFASFEYHGADFKADMALMAADPATQRWWAIMEPFQRQIPGTPEGEWWMPMEEMFHFAGPSPAGAGRAACRACGAVSVIIAAESRQIPAPAR